MALWLLNIVLRAVKPFVILHQPVLPTADAHKQNLVLELLKQLPWTRERLYETLYELSHDAPEEALEVLCRANGESYARNNS